MKKRETLTPLSKADKEFFQRFYEQFKHLLYHEARAYAANGAEREDLVQEVLLRLMKNIPVLQTLTQSKTAYYIVLTVRTTYIDTLRLQKNGGAFPLDDTMIEKLSADMAHLPEKENSICAQMAVKSLKDSLPQRDWLVLVGKYIMGYSHEELSGLLGIEQTNVRMILTRAKEKARKLLRKNGWTGGGSDA